MADDNGLEALRQKECVHIPTPTRLSAQRRPPRRFHPARRELNERLDEQKERLVNEAEVALRAQEEKLSAGVGRQPRPADALELGPDGLDVGEVGRVVPHDAHRATAGQNDGEERQRVELGPWEHPAAHEDGNTQGSTANL